MFALRELVTAAVNRSHVHLPRVTSGCAACRNARALTDYRAVLVSEWTNYGHICQLGPSYLNNRLSLDVSCPRCGSRVLAYLELLPEGPALWVEAVSLVFGCRNVPEGKEYRCHS